MALEELPEVSVGIYQAHKSRIATPEEYKNFIINTANDLFKKNNMLYNYIEVEASHNTDPEQVIRVAYTVLNLINDKLEADKLEKSFNKE